jgi:hypothetical protein
VSEGSLHARLVQELVTFIRRMPRELSVPTLVDLPGTDQELKPPTLNGFVPDVYVPGTSPIIGEAKTLRDLETEHTRLQISAFLESISGSSSPGCLVLAVPLTGVNYAKSIIRNICRRNPTTDLVRVEYLYLGATSSYGAQ